jgi:hypothetical protein
MTTHLGDARLLSIAADAVEDGKHAAERAVKNAKREISNARDEVVYRIKREPLTAVGAAFGAGMLLGTIGTSCAWFASRRCRTGA